MKATTQDRLVNFALIVAAAALFSLSAWVKPSASGMGTHERLGLPP